MTDFSREVVTIVEIDVPICNRTYGSIPCTASLGAEGEAGTTGTRKCFNTAATCQDRDNFFAEQVTQRFGISQSGLTQYGPIIPSLQSVSISPLQINVGGMDDSASPFGQRESCSLKFEDHLHSDSQMDNYRAERISGEAQNDGIGYDPYTRGTFWGKWVARHPFHEGYPVRVYQGIMGQTLPEMQLRQYYISKITGPNNGAVAIECKDLFTRVEQRKAKAPKPSQGELTADITGGASSIELSPSGIGDLEYPASGWVAVGDEIMAFTRSSDTLTLTERGALGTEADEHEEQDTVQLVLPYESEEVSDIVEDLLATYAAVESEHIPKAEWDAEDDAHINELYTAYIAEPTPVEDLIGELAVQAGFSIWPDVATNEIQIKAFAPTEQLNPGPLVDDHSWILADSFSTQRKPEKRVSQVWVYYGQRNPLEGVDKASNYASRLILADLASEADEEYGTTSIREIWGRWLPRFARGVAQNAANRILSVFRDPPLHGGFAMDVGRDGQLNLATPFRLQIDDVQDDTGAARITHHVPVQMFRDSTKVSVKFQELEFTTIPEVGFNIFIDSDANSINIRDEFDLQFGAPEDGDVVNVFVAEDIVVSSDSSSVPAMDVGDWPSGVEITIVIQAGAIVTGRGGDGGAGGDADVSQNKADDGVPGNDGGIGLYTRYAVIVENNGTIAAGGAGGGGGGAVSGNTTGGNDIAYGGGGGGGGEPFGAGGDAGAADASGEGGTELEEPGQAGGTASLTSPGDGGDGGTRDLVAAGGDGGDGGAKASSSQAGASGNAFSPGDFDELYEGSGGAGGSPGDAVDGDSFVTYNPAGTITGAQVN